jgi:excisionase family DNA binding protein
MESRTIVPLSRGALNDKVFVAIERREQPWIIAAIQSRPANVGQNRQDLVAAGPVRVKAAAEFLQLGRTTIYGLMEKRILTYVKIGKARRIPKKALIDFETKNVISR